MLEIFLCWDSYNEPNSKYSKDIKDSHLSLKKENGGEININI